LKWSIRSALIAIIGTRARLSSLYAITIAGLMIVSLRLCHSP
jgi:hypothetical protein